ncbi:uncharacterized protein LOC144119604 [Amblyomma americanum]
MAETERLVALGKELGLEGAELREFLREERAAERERRRLEDEREKERDAREKERDAREKERSDRKLQEIDKEMALLQLRANSNISGSSVSEPSSSTMPTRALGVRPHKLMAPFNEKGDDLDAYLTRFERVAAAQQWPREQWATALSTCLTGEALNVFGRMPAPDSNDYDKVKLALLLRFRLTEEGFRQKFRNETPNDHETPSQFVSRLGNYWGRWIELSKTDKTYEGVKGLILAEQLLENCAPAMVTFIREKRSTDLKELVQRADEYVMARGTINFGRRGSKTDSLVAGEMTEQPRGPGTRSRCYICSRPGHIAAQCRANRGPPVQKNRTPSTSGNVSTCIEDGYLELKGGQRVPVVSMTALSGAPDLPVVEGLISGRKGRVLRDTGCNMVIVNRSFVKDEEMTGDYRIVYLVDRSAKFLPEARIHIDTPYYRGEVTAGCMEEPLFDLVLGNIEGVRRPGAPDTEWKPQTSEETEAPPKEHHDSCDKCPDQVTMPTAAVTTRQQAARQSQEGFRKLRAPATLPDVSPDQMRQDQREDSSLLVCFEADKQRKRTRCKGGSSFTFGLRDGLLYREYVPGTGAKTTQLVVPQKHREKVLQLAHGGLMAGHLGRKKTTDRILADFFWPGLQGDVSRFVASCDICQKTVARGAVRKVPLERVPLVDTPFSKVAVDIVGPLKPTTRRGNRYILTLIDYATRFPEAVALPSIETERVAEALLHIFARVGVPEEMLSDRGSNFTSELMAEVGRLLSLRLKTTTPYHPMANGLVEKMNGTLKKMLRRMCAEQPKDWDRFIEPLLFAYREVAQASTGFSPFELLYGRNVRGPLAILRELWTGSRIEEEVKTAYEYVIDLKERLETTCQIAHEALTQAGERYKAYYDNRARPRQLQEGDQVLLLLPTEHNKLTMRWKGPYPVVGRKGEVDYVVDVEGTTRMFHINMLKKYNARETRPELPVQTVATVAADEACTELIWPLDEQVGPQDIAIAGQLTPQQVKELRGLALTYQDVFTEQPGFTTWAECSLPTTTNKPIYVKQYPLPQAVQQAVEKEVSSMLQMGVIEKSRSPHNAPVVLVKKPDGCYRFCVDFRKLNDVLVTDAEPIPRADCLIAEVGARRYFSKMDLAKGYWQVPLEEESKEKTAFSTPSGHYQFKNMPFGIKTAPAVFAKLMRRVLEGIDNVYHYYDNVLVATESWQDHMTALSLALARIRAAGLTIHPKKCHLGFEELSFLGHTIGRGSLGPMKAILGKIRDSPRPKTKRQVRAFLGLSGYYREFIPNYSSVAAPLTDLTKKLMPNTVKWGDREQHAFTELKRLLSEPPILQVADFKKDFVLRTDASDQGLGAVLLQGKEGVLHPVAYASRKLLQRERAYSAVEKEGLAIVWAIKRFNFFLYGRKFTLQTDHQPLKYIREAQFMNSRLLRWALLLQEYDFTVENIRGKDNVGADYLSRVWEPVARRVDDL